MSNPLLDRYPHSGKFEGELNLTEKLWNSDGGPDEELGESESFGYFMLFTNLEKDLGDLGGITAAILDENSQGFVSGTYYENLETARKVWQKIERQWEKSLEQFFQE